MKFPHSFFFVYVLFYFMLMPSTAFTQTVEQISGVAVFDNNGLRVGPVIGIGEISSTVLVGMKIDDMLVILNTGPNDLTTAFGGETVFFESADCTGTPLMNEGQSGFWPKTIIGGPAPGQPGGGGDHILYRPDFNTGELAGGGSFSFGSRAQAKSEECNNSPSGGNHVIPLQPFQNINTIFTRPFHIAADTAANGTQPYDLNGDGKADLLWRHRGNGVVAVWLMNGATVASTAFLGGVPSSWKIEQIADLNGDGKADVVWQNANGTVAVWLMDGTVIESVGFPGGVSPEWEIQP